MELVHNKVTARIETSIASKAAQTGPGFFGHQSDTEPPHAALNRQSDRRPQARPQAYKLTLDRGLQLRIAPDGVRTLLVRYTVKGSAVERQYRLLQEYGEGPGQLKRCCAQFGDGTASWPGNPLGRDTAGRVDRPKRIASMVLQQLIDA